MIHRQFDPQTGRFTSLDPVIEGQEHLSLYQYGWNNPVLRSDPNGDCPNCFVGFIIGASVDYGFQVFSRQQVQSGNYKKMGLVVASATTYNFVERPLVVG